MDSLMESKMQNMVENPPRHRGLHLQNGKILNSALQLVLLPIRVGCGVVRKLRIHQQYVAEARSKTWRKIPISSMGERWEMLLQGSQLLSSTQKSSAEEESSTSILSAVPINGERGFRWPEKEMFLCEEVFKLVRSVINPRLVGSGQKSM